MKVEHKKKKERKKRKKEKTLNGASEWGIFRLHRSRLITESNNA